MVLGIDPEDEEVSRVNFFVDELAEGADFRQLLRGQVVVGAGTRSKKNN